MKSPAAPRDEPPAESTATTDRPLEDRPLPPGPDGLPVVGDTFALMRDPFEYFETLVDYGDIVQYRAMGNRFVALLNPEYVERVLVEEPNRFERWSFGDVGLEFASEGVLAVDGSQWRRQRELMQPAFTVERIRSYADTMAELARQEVDEWDDGAVVDLNERLSALTLRILANALFDITVDPTDDDEAIVRAAQLLNELSGPKVNVTMYLPDWLPTPTQRRYQRTMDAYEDRLDELAERRRANPGDDLLSLLLEAEGETEGLTEREIRDNMLTFLFAGHETTSLGLAYTFLLLARHDEAATRLRVELDEVVGEDAPGFEHVPHLEYTERVVREAMRLYPPAYILFRRATEDAAIGGYRVPEGTILTLPSFHIHTDGRFYDDPEVFRPERWASENDRPEYAYFPFGGGPRHCIGMRFAMLEMQLVAATVARAFDLELVSDSDPDLSPRVTLRPESNIRVRVRKRD